MLKATFVLPRLATVRCWAGMYGGHYDIIVFFREKPTNWEDGYVDCLAERRIDNIFADMCLGEFQSFFPDVDLSPYLQNERPKDIEIGEVFEIELTLPVNSKAPMDINFHQDW